MDTRIISADGVGVAEAAAMITRGLPVAVPSETVYGLAGDAQSDAAIAAIYEAKGRPAFNPLIVHILDIAMAERIAEVSPLARLLAGKFWPGPLTMVLPVLANAPISSLVTAGLSTVALRAPAHPVMRAVIAAADRPLAAPSANASGSISATRADHVARSLAGRIGLVLDGGGADVGIESTIVKVESDRLSLLRPGSITTAMIEAATGVAVEVARTGAIEAPGQMASHYAPSKPVRLGATAALPGEYLIGFGAIGGDISLSPEGDLTEAAARLFEALHIADRSGATGIAIAPIPSNGLGLAINDRLQRAAAPRS